MYHSYSDMWLVSMRCILRLVFNVAMSFFTTVPTLWTASLAQPSVGTVPNLIAPGMRAIITVLSAVGCGYLPTQWRGLTSLAAS